VVPAGQPLGHRRDEGHTELAQDAEVARREGVVPHEGVHRWRDVDGLAVVPRAHHAREEVVAQPAGDLARQAELSDEEESGGGIRRESTRPCPYLGEGVGRERRDDEGVSPPAELDVQDLVADAPPAGSLVVFGVERDAAGEGGPVDEVEGGRGRHRADVGPLGDAAAEALELDGRHAAGGRQEDAGPPTLRARRRRRLLRGHRREAKVGPLEPARLDLDSAAPRRVARTSEANSSWVGGSWAARAEKSGEIDVLRHTVAVIVFMTKGPIVALHRVCLDE